MRCSYKNCVNCLLAKRIISIFNHSVGTSSYDGMSGMLLPGSGFQIGLENHHCAVDLSRFWSVRKLHSFYGLAGSILRICYLNYLMNLNVSLELSLASGLSHWVPLV